MSGLESLSPEVRTDGVTTLPLPLPAQPPLAFAESAQDSYAHVLATVPLTPEQRTLASQLLQMAQARDLAELPHFLALVKHPQYKHLANVKGRELFHSPFADLYANLTHKADRTALVEALVEAGKQPEGGPYLEELAEIFFYALRPGGKLDPQHPHLLKQHAPLTPLAYAQAREHLLQQFYQLTHSSDLNLTRRMQNALRNRVFELVVFTGFRPRHITTAELDGLRKEMTLLVDPLQVRHRDPASHEDVQMFAAAALDADPSVFEAYHHSGALENLVPEWARMKRPENTQHSAHDFTLVDHTLKVIAATKRAKAFASLSPQQQQVVTLAAVFHDLQKKVGPENLRSLILPDRAHPLKPADVAAECMMSFGFSPEAVRQATLLVTHHQMLGTMIMCNPDGMPPEEVLFEAARLIETAETLAMLRALTEGDIRSVKAKDALFTDDVAEQLTQFADAIEARIEAARQAPQRHSGSKMHALAELVRLVTPI